MFQTIMVPVDLSHLTACTGAIDAAATLARQHGAGLVLVSVTAATPTAVARNPQDFAQRLAALAGSESTRLGVTISAHAITAHDPTIDMDRHLLDAIRATGADLVVMATHSPGPGDYLWSGHGAHLAAHAPTSVFLLR